MIRGIGVSEGLIVAKAILKKEKKIEVVRRDVVNVEEEVARLTDAVYHYTEQLEKTYKKALNVLGEDEAAIHKNHLNILRDSVVIGGVKKQIRDKGVNAEFVLDEVKSKYESIFKRMDDAFLRKKAEYIKNITEGIIKQLTNADVKPFSIEEGPVVLIAESMDSSDTMELEKDDVAAIVIGDADKLNQCVMLSKNWKIPCVIGVKNILGEISEGDLLMVDGNSGEIIVNPDEGTLDAFKNKQNKEEELDKVYNSYIDERTMTKDGFAMDLNAIVSKDDEVASGVQFGCDQVGLYRTEHLFIGISQMPSEEDQFKAYSNAATNAGNRHLCIRTFDCHGHSDLPYIHVPDQVNPDLGYFSTRIALHNREILLTQIKAILRTSAVHDVSFAIPMVSSIDEIREIKVLIEEAMMDLSDKGKPYNKKTKYGVILEMPSVAIITNFFAQEVDFIYVDVDDMLQYVAGTDRRNEIVNEYYDYFHPGFLRILRSMIRAAHRDGTKISFTGRLCSEELLIPIFIAMGVDELVVHYKDIPKVRWEINSMEKSFWEAQLETILKFASGKKIKHHLEKVYGEHFLWDE